MINLARLEVRFNVKNQNFKEPNDSRCQLSNIISIVKFIRTTRMKRV